MIIMPFSFGSSSPHSTAQSFFSLKTKTFLSFSSLHFRWVNFYIFHAFSHKQTQQGRSINICTFHVLSTASLAHLSSRAMPHHHNWTLFNSMSNVSINKHFLPLLYTKARALFFPKFFSVLARRQAFSFYSTDNFLSPFNSSNSFTNAFKAQTI